MGAIKFSYSKLNTYDNCRWKYKLTYSDGHYTFTESIATEFGTLVHFIEESIGRSLIIGEKPDYEKLKDDFINLNIPKKDKFDNKGGIYGIKYLKEKYHDEYYEINDNGESYQVKAKRYLDTGIYRLENLINSNPGFKMFSVEQFFQIEYEGMILSGYIDRIIHDELNDMFYIDDIKTKSKLFKEDELTTPLQFVIYTKALMEMLCIKEDQIKCHYDLPFCETRQAAGTKGYLTRGEEKLSKIITGIKNKDFKPDPCPLCYWCPFSATNPDQKDDAKGLCAYYSLWTPTHKVKDTANKWSGIANDEEICKKFFKLQSTNKEEEIDF